MKKYVVSFLLLILSLSLFSYRLFKVPKEAKAVVGTLNLNAQTSSTLQTPGGIWTSGGNVGIGITIPAYPLDVTGNVRASGHLGLSGSVPSANWSIYADETFTNTDAVGGIKTYAKVYTTGASAGHTGYGSLIYGLAYPASTFSNTGAMYGTYSISGNYDIGTLAAATGVYGQIQNNTTGTITTAYGLRSYINNASSGTITTGYGVHIADVDATTDYGLYQVGANDTNYFAGNVGIGTTNPDAKLKIYDSSDGSGLHLDAPTSAAMRFQRAGTNKWGLLNNNAGTDYFGVYDYTRNNYVLVFKPNSDSYFNVGNVGIGTTGPTSKLEVQGGYLKVSDTVGAADTSKAFMEGGTNIAYFGALSTQPAYFGNSESWSTLVADGGNVGIGTTAPGAPLEIYWDSGAYNPAAYMAGQLTLNMADTVGDYTGIRFKNAAGSTEKMIGVVQVTDNYGDIVIQGYDRATTYKEYLRITESGNVGIGDTSPSYKLEVAGVVYASGSSRDYKQDIKNLEVDSSKIYGLQPVSYDYKKEYKDLGYTLAGGRQFGLIAEDTYKVIPELVISKNDKKTANIDYEKLSVLLLAEMKKLKSTVDQQQKQIDKLQTILNLSKP